MRIILATDIFGLTDSVLKIVKTLKNRGLQVILVSPYGEKKEQFADEKSAYAAFIEHCGHDIYYERIFSEVRQNGNEIIIGFSAGASASWRVCANLGKSRVRHFIGFYPTRIRHYLQQIPTSPTTLIFPKVEARFCVDSLMREIRRNSLVQCFKTPYFHGFMNPLSQNYVQEADNCLNRTLSVPEILTDQALFVEVFVKEIGESCPLLQV